MDELKVTTIKTKEQAIKLSNFYIKSKVLGPLADSEKIQFSNILSTLTNPKGIFYFVQINKQIVGAIGLWQNPNSNDEFLIRHFGVIVEFREKGIGSILLKYSELFAKKNAAKKIVIETSTDEYYKLGNKFYEKRGYKKEKVYLKYYFSKSDRVDYVKQIE